MRVWRIDRAKRNPLDGLGGLYVSGRWNPKGVRMVYTSAHPSLAVLEALVHLNPDILPEDLVVFQIEIPDDVAREELPESSLPTDWRAVPPPASTQEIGRLWAGDRTRPAVLGVPSVVVPEERNYLLNPAHSDAVRWKVVHRDPFRFDPRIL